MARSPRPWRRARRAVSSVHRLRRPGRSSPGTARRTRRSGSRDPAWHARSDYARQLADALNPFAGGGPRVVRAPRLAGRAGRLWSEHFSQALEQAGIRLRGAREQPAGGLLQPRIDGDRAPQAAARSRRSHVAETLVREPHDRRAVVVQCEHALTPSRDDALDDRPAVALAPGERTLLEPGGVLHVLRSVLGEKPAAVPEVA